MKKSVILLALTLNSIVCWTMVSLSSCKSTPPHPPYTVTTVKEENSQCVIYYKDEDGNKGHKTIPYNNMKKYKEGDVLTIIPF